MCVHCEKTFELKKKDYNEICNKVAQKINGRPNKFTTFLNKLLCLIQKTAQIELAFQLSVVLTGDAGLLGCMRACEQRQMEVSCK